MPIENVNVIEKVTANDRYLDEHAGDGRPPRAPHPLDSPKSKKRHSQLFEWYNQERERQAANRYQQAIDEDYYDNLQWSEEEANELIDRGQAPLVFNECAATIDWIIGTEKRTRVDFKVFPRTEDDVEVAKAKTDTLKYLSDVNKTSFARSLAFEDSVKVGVGWLEDGARDDPTEEPIFSRYENWRHMFWDSLARERDLSDARYIYRIRWTDLDIALAMFPDRRHQLQSAAISSELWGNEEEEDFWYLGKHFTARDQLGEVIGRRTFLSDVATVNNRRPRVKLIEGWYRTPTVCRYCNGGEFDGKKFDSENPVMKAALQRGLSLYDRLEMTIRCAIFTEKDLMQDVPSPYRHNRFPFTPIWAYKRGRDGMPYGPMRRMRDPQDDLNKRASKALFALSTNRVTADADSVEDHDEAREEAARPDMYIIKKKGSEFTVENNYEVAQGHLELMDRDERFIQKTGGVTDDNMGRRTNATSGEAIKARQLQGSVVTAPLFSNLRFAVQNQGEATLSLAEQFITQPKAVRLVGAAGKKLEWTKINTPEVDAMGNVRFLNDITASQADFVVDEQDFQQSVRQAMFEAMVELVAKITAVNPEAGLRILRMALEFSDLPNKDEMAGEVKSILGIVDEEDLRKMTPEQMEEYQAGVAAKREAAAIQRQAAMGEAREKVAKADKTAAEAQKIMAEAKALGAQGDAGALAEIAVRQAALEAEQRVVEAERRAAEAVDAARQEIERLQQQATDRRAQIDADAATKRDVAKVDADARVASVEADGRTKLALADKDKETKLALADKDKDTKLAIADKDNVVKVQVAEKQEGTKREVGKAQAVATEKTDRSAAHLDGALKKLTDQVREVGSKVESIEKAVEEQVPVKERTRKKEVTVVMPDGKVQTVQVTIKSIPDSKEKKQ